MGGATTCVTHSATDDFNHEKLDSQSPQSSVSLFPYPSTMLSALPLKEGSLLIVDKNRWAFEDGLTSVLQGKRWKKGRRNYIVLLSYGKKKFPLLLTVVQLTQIGCGNVQTVRNDYCVMMFIIIFICVNIYLQSIIPRVRVSFLFTRCLHAHRHFLFASSLSVLFIIKVALPSINPSAWPILPHYECNLQTQRCSSLYQGRGTKASLSL